ncbi:MAG TPA: LppP/LprE family lipoprotein [Solirubrobacteraceae bacterium]|nr:LppP/LprE family lipoprotein [Solirubrobacteraceae bacterium]
MKGRSMRALALAALFPAALASCGGSTKTVTAESHAGAEGPTGASSTTTKTATTPSNNGSGDESSGGSAAQGTTPSTTRTATEPQFDQGQSSSSQEAQQAAAAVRARGYAPGDLAEYHPSQTLRTLVGTRSGSTDGYGQEVFFFVDGRFIGTDTKEPSASVKVISQNDTEAVVAYTLYRPGDPLSSPSGGQAVVHFQLNNGKLVPAGTIPPVHSSTGTSRL